VVSMADLTVVIPSFNSAPYLENTLRSLEASLLGSGWEARIVVVDDGSTDNTLQVLADLSPSIAYPLDVLSQENKGRFLARWAGISAADSEYVLLLDSRVLMDTDAPGFVHRALREEPGPLTWNAYVRTDANSKLAGLFWDVPTRLFWGNFLANPRAVTVTIDEFDSFPKGTTCLLAPLDALTASCLRVWPEGDASLVSDDTKLLRDLVASHPLRLDPNFGATYLPRVTFKSFLSHTFTRGTLFVDSYAGTSGFRRMILAAFALLPVFLVVATLLHVFGWLMLAALIALLAPAVIGLCRKASWRATLAYLVYVLPFGLVFWAGLVRGIWVHRHHFGPGRKVFR
jgi:glycosyltransferase involved in cell wall biosynthesis